MENKNMEEKEMSYCNQCSNHCPETALKCGRGRNYFGIAEDGATEMHGSEHPDEYHREHYGERHGEHHGEHHREHHGGHHGEHRGGGHDGVHRGERHGERHVIPKQ